MNWNERTTPPPGDFWSPALILRLTDGSVRSGHALIMNEAVHSWFWFDTDQIVSGTAASEGCYGGIKVEMWALAPTVAELVEAMG